MPFVFRLGFGFWAVGTGFDSFSPKENCCHPDLLSKGDAGEWNCCSFLLREICVFYKIGALGWFLSKNALRRGKAKLLLPRLSSCKGSALCTFLLSFVVNWGVGLPCAGANVWPHSLPWHMSHPGVSAGAHPCPGSPREPQGCFPSSDTSLWSAPATCSAQENTQPI